MIHCVNVLCLNPAIDNKGEVTDIITAILQGKTDSLSAVRISFRKLIECFDSICKCEASLISPHDRKCHAFCSIESEDILRSDTLLCNVQIFITLFLFCRYLLVIGSRLGFFLLL